MPSVLLSVLRTGAQALVGYVVTYLVSHGINVPIEAQNYVIEGVIVVAGIAAWTALVRWLETRKGEALFARGARALARLLMLGLGARTPIYVAKGQSVIGVSYAAPYPDER